MNEVKIVITGQNRSKKAVAELKEDLAGIGANATKAGKASKQASEEIAKGAKKAAAETEKLAESTAKVSQKVLDDFPKFTGTLGEIEKQFKEVAKSTGDVSTRLQKLTPQAKDFTEVSLGLGATFKQAMRESGAAVDELALHVYKASRELGDSLYTGLRLERVHAAVSVVTDRIGAQFDSLTTRVSSVADKVSGKAGAMLDAAIAPFQRGRDRLVHAAEEVTEAWEKAADDVQDAMINAGHVIAALWMRYVQQPLLRTRDYAVSTSKSMADAVVHGLERVKNAGVSSAAAVANAVDLATAPFRTFGTLAVDQAERAGRAFWSATAPVRAFTGAVAGATAETAKLAGKVAAPFGKVGALLVSTMGDAGSRAGQAALNGLGSVFGKSRQKVVVEVDKDRFASSLDNLHFDFGKTKFGSSLDFGKAAGAALREGLTSALSSAWTGAVSTLPKLLNPAGMTALAAGAAALGTLAGGALAGGIVAGAGAGIAALGVVAAAKSGQVRSAFSNLARDVNNDLAEIATPFQKSLLEIVGQAKFEFGRLKPILRSAFDEAAPAVENFGENLVRAFGRFRPAIKPLTDGFTAVLDDLGPRLPGVIERVAGAFGRLAKSVSDNPQAIGDLVDTVSNFVVVMTEAVRLLNEGYGKVRKFLEGLAGIEKIPGHATASKDAINALAASAENGTSPARALEDAIKAVGGASDETATKADALRRALDLLQGQTPDYTDALGSAADSIRSLDGAFKDADDRAKGFGDGLLTASGAFDVTNENGLMLYKNVRDVEGAFTNMAKAVQDGQMSREQFIGDTGRMRDRLNDTWRQAGLTEAQIAALNAQYGLTPEQIMTMVRLLGAADAEQTLNQLARARTATVYIQQQVSTYGGYLGTGLNGQAIFHDRAHGGVVASFAHGGVVARAAAGGVRRSNVVVNDWGATDHGEAIRLPQGSTVIPAGMTRSMESRWGTDRGAGQAGLIQVSLTLDGKVLATQLINPMKGVVRNRGGDPGVFG